MAPQTIAKVYLKKLIAPGLMRAAKDILAGRDTDPKSATYGQKLREYWLNGGRGCVDGDTLIDTPRGKVRVRDFNGGKVYSYSADGRIVECEADAPTRYEKQDLYQVRTRGGAKLLVTDEHLFFNGDGWVKTKDLSVGCLLTTYINGVWIENDPVERIEFVKHDHYYDFNVEESHNYLAGGFINHNSTKSSLISLLLVYHLVTHPRTNAVVFVKVAENIRDSVYKQILWAIDHLELNAYFKCTTSPFRCTYIPTGQEILFRGLDKAGKIKGIKPSIGYFDQIWFEELTEFSGMEDVRSVIQSALRGGDEDDDEIAENVPTWEFYSYNPPPTMANWVNVEANVVTPGRKVYQSNYLTVPPRWLRKDFFIRADILKKTNPRAYRHEYLGEITGTGRNIFTNLEIREITDEEIATFNNRCFGIDWGFAGDPFVWEAMNFDRDHLDLYVFDEIVDYGLRTQVSAEKVKQRMDRFGGLAPVLCDSAEPDSIADYNAWGVRAEGCPKPHGKTWSGRDYEIMTLQSLNRIIIDKKYCPETARKMQMYEYPINAHGDVRHEYPHFDELDAIRYGSFYNLRDCHLYDF